MDAPRKRRWWRLIRRALYLGLFALALWLLASRARQIDWPQVLAALHKLDPMTLALAALFVVLSYATYACIDLFARVRACGVPCMRAMAIAFVSYAFNQNLGAFVGSVGFRYRLYSRYGLSSGTIAGIVGLSLVTNWSGYLLLAGITLLFRFIGPPPSWQIGVLGMQLLGAALLLVVAAYVALCACSRRRRWTLRGTELRLPGLRMALGQIGLSTANWLLIAAILYVLLDRHLDFATVLGVFLLSSIAGSVTHIPAGLGVLEAVFFAMVGHRVPQHELIAALLAYRALYYLLPLGFGLLGYLWLETRAAVAQPAQAR
jgi:uncharacterized membrane protein YbhN (UPF0104 family)